MVAEYKLIRKTDYEAKTRYQDIEIAEGYDEKRFSDLLGRWVDHLEKRTLVRCLGELDREDLILDLPMGTGRIAAYLLSKGFKVAGADISEEMMTIAKKRMEGIPNFVGAYRQDAEQLTFPNKSFDAIVSVRLMGHLPPHVRTRVLREMSRVAKKILVITYYVSGITTDVSKFLQSIGRQCGHTLYPVREKDMRKEIEEAGLEIIKNLPMFRFVSECHFLVLRPRSS